MKSLRVSFFVISLYAGSFAVGEEPSRPPSAAPKVGKTAAPEPREHTYGEVDGQKLLVDVYVAPANDAATKRPAVLLLHGGGWCGGSRKDVAKEARALAAHGYIAFSASYRLGNAPERLKDPALPVRNRYPAAVDDCQRAVRWIRRRADEFNVDPNRIAAIGWSAGGHLAALLGTTDTRDNSDPELSQYSSRVNAAINVFGPADFMVPLPETNLAGQPPDPQAQDWRLRNPVRWLQDEFLGSTDDAVRREASPFHHVDTRTSPFLIIHGTEDKLVPIQQGRSFHQRLRAQNVDSTLVEFPGEGHGWAKPETQRRFAQEVLKFLGRTVGNPVQGK